METRPGEHTGNILWFSYFNIRSNPSFSLDKNYSNLFSLQHEMHMWSSTWPTCWAPKDGSILWVCSRRTKQTSIKRPTSSHNYSSLASCCLYGQHQQYDYSDMISASSTTGHQLRLAWPRRLLRQPSTWPRRPPWLYFDCGLLGRREYFDSDRK